MKNLLFLSTILLALASCSNPAVQQELSDAKAALASAQSQIDSLSALVNADDSGKLVHVVYFKVKPDTDQAAFIAEVKKLSSIEVLEDLEVGPFEDLGDPRALSEYNMVMQMTFADSTAYAAYQAHPTHEALKANTKSYMAGPPATYDFVLK